LMRLAPSPSHAWLQLAVLFVFLNPNLTTGGKNCYRNIQFQFTQINPNLNHTFTQHFRTKANLKISKCDAFYAVSRRHVWCILICKTKNKLTDKSLLRETCGVTDG
jgi:hypothetical protein